MALVPPRFFAPRSLGHLVQWIEDVAKVIPKMPVFYYHLDIVNYTPYPIHNFLELAAPRIPNLCGMKFTDYNSFEMGLCLDASNGRFTVMMGREEVGVIRAWHVGDAGCAVDGLHGLRGIDVLRGGEAVRPDSERVREGRLGGSAEGNVARARIHRAGELRREQIRRGRGLDHAVQGDLGLPGRGGGSQPDVWVREGGSCEG